MVDANTHAWLSETAPKIISIYLPIIVNLVFMKMYFLAALLLSLSSSFAQNCSSYYLLQNNRRIDNTIYNKSGQVFGKQHFSVNSVSSSADATTANVHIEMVDKDDNPVSNSTNTIKCKGGVMMMNMKMALPQQQQALGAEGTAKGESAFIEYPSAMKIGDKLKNAQFNMDMNRGGMQQHVNMLISNRKVEGKEKITTKAGSWDCFKISYKGKITVNAMGMVLPIDLTGTEWFAPNFGLVKTKSNFGSSEITSIK
jgi:hypothetical protein